MHEGRGHLRNNWALFAVIFNTMTIFSSISSDIVHPRTLNVLRTGPESEVVLRYLPSLFAAQIVTLTDGVLPE